jgi:hypothetical protein
MGVGYVRSRTMVGMGCRSRWEVRRMTTSSRDAGTTEHPWTMRKETGPLAGYQWYLAGAAEGTARCSPRTSPLARRCTRILMLHRTLYPFGQSRAVARLLSRLGTGRSADADASPALATHRKRCWTRLPYANPCDLRPPALFTHTHAYAFGSAETIPSESMRNRYCPLPTCNAPRR